MPGIIDRIQELSEEKKRDRIPFYEKNEEEFGKGYRNSELTSSYRLIAVADYLTTKDPEVFRSTLKKALSYRLALYEAPDDAPEKRFFDNELHHLNHVMDSLAIGDWGFTVHMMSLLANLTHKEAHPLPKCLHILMRGMILDTEENFPKKIDEAIVNWGKKQKSYLGYAQGFKAIYEQDSDAFVEALTLTMKGHKRLCHPAGRWGNTVDEVIAIWPLGLANLARMEGLDFEFDHPLLPSDLIVPVSSEAS